MRRLYRTVQSIFSIAMLLSLVGLFVYSQLDESHKRYVKNLIRQIPDLPGRYVI